MKCAGKWLVPAEGVKLSGILLRMKTVIRIVSLETPGIRGPKVQRTRRRFESLRQKDRECLMNFLHSFFAWRAELSSALFLFYYGNYEELMSYNIHICCACTKSNIYYDIVT